MGILERIKAAANGLIPVEDDLDMGDSSRVRNLPAPQDSNDAARLADAGGATTTQTYRQRISGTPPNPADFEERFLGEYVVRATIQAPNQFGGGGVLFKGLNQTTNINGDQNQTVTQNVGHYVISIRRESATIQDMTLEVVRSHDHDI